MIRHYNRYRVIELTEYGIQFLVVISLYFANVCIKQDVTDLMELTATRGDCIENVIVHITSPCDLFCLALPWRSPYWPAQPIAMQY